MRTQDDLDFGARLEVLEDERLELVCDCGARWDNLRKKNSSHVQALAAERQIAGRCR